MVKDKHKLGKSEPTSRGDSPNHNTKWETDPNAARGPGDTYGSPLGSSYEPSNTSLGK